MGRGDSFSFYSYTSDDGNTYGVKLSAEDANAGGFEASGSVTDFWEFGTKNLRHVWGVTSDGLRTRLPCASADASAYNIGASFNLRGRSYTVQGVIGERRRLNSVG